jgi:Domain of unknown function (DUF4277)
MGNFAATDIIVQDLDHSGIVVGICDEIGLVEQIDRLLGTHPQEVIVVGEGVKSYRQVYAFDPFGNRLELLEFIGE